MGLFSWIKECWNADTKLRLLTDQLNKGIDGLAAPIRSGASDTQIAASIATLNDLTQTVKLQGTGTVRRKV